MAHEDSAPLAESYKPFRQPLQQRESGSQGSDLVTRVDAQTNVLHLMRGEAAQKSVRDVGPLVQGVVPVDERGNVGKVSEDGSLHVVQVTRGLPFFKNAITGANAYADVFRVSRDCHHLRVGAETSGVVIGLKLPGCGSTVDAWGLVSDAAIANNMACDDIDIPAGTTVRIRNQVKDVNAANACVSVW